MRRRLFVLLLSVVLAVPLWSENLVGFGFRGGFELTEMNFNTNALRESNRAGFYVGPTLRIDLPLTGMDLDVALLYSKRDLKVAGETMGQKSLLLPVNARYGVGVGDVVGIFASIGPQFSFNIGDDIFYWKDKDNNNNQYSLQNTLISFNLGMGVTIGGHLEAGVYYNIPAGKTADFTWDRLGSELRNTTWERAKSKTNAWHVAVSYYF